MYVDMDLFVLVMSAFILQVDVIKNSQFQWNCSCIIFFYRKIFLEHWNMYFVVHVFNNIITNNVCDQFSICWLVTCRKPLP